MIWIIFTVVSSLAYTIHDLILKQVSDQHSSTLTTIILNISAFSFAIMYLIFFEKTEINQTHVFNFSTLLTIVAGLFLTIATISFVKIFSSGGQISVALPVLYSGIIILGFIFGVIFWKEPFNLINLLGLGITIFGLFLIL